MLRIGRGMVRENLHEQAKAADDEAGHRVTRLLGSAPFVVLVALAAALPLLLAPVPPLTDVGGHLARYAVQLGGAGAAGQWYQFSWALVPNLGCDLLIAALAPVLGLEAGVKAMVVLIAALQAAGILLLSRVAHGRVSPIALFAIPFVYGLPLLYGFLNYSLGIALVLPALALWLDLGRRERIAARAALFVPIGFGLWVCHQEAWAVFCVAAFADEVVRLHRRGRPLAQTILQAGLAMIPLTAGPLAGLALANGAAPREWAKYDLPASKPGWLIMALRDSWLAWDKAGAIAAIVLIGWTWRSPRCSLHRGLALAGILLLAIYAVMPSTLMGSAYTDMRLVPMIMILFLVAARPSQAAGARLVMMLAVAGCAFSAARLGGNAISAIRHGEAFESSLAVLDQVPRGTNLLTFEVYRCGLAEEWDFDRRTHLSGYSVVRRGAFDNHQWQIPGGQLITVGNPDARPFDKEPGITIFDRPCGSGMALPRALDAVSPRIGLVWVMGAPAAVDPRKWAVIARSGDSRLLRRVNPAG